MLMLLPGCSLKEKLMKDEISDKYLEYMLTKINDKDEAAAYDLFIKDNLDEEEFNRGFKDIIAQWDGDKDYTYKKIGQYKNTFPSSGGNTVSVDCTYEVTTKNNEYVVALNRVELPDGRNGLNGFRIMTKEEWKLSTEGVGKLKDIRDFNGIQWMLLGVSVIFIGITVFTLVDCAKRKIKLKPLWIIIILIFIYLGVFITPNESKMLFGFSTINYSRFIQFFGSTIQVLCYFPVGALIYWIFKKKITKKAVEEEKNIENTEEISQEK